MNVAKALVEAGYATTSLCLPNGVEVFRGRLNPDIHWYPMGQHTRAEYLGRYGATLAIEAEKGGSLLPPRWDEAENELKWITATSAAAKDGWFERSGIPIPAGTELTPEDSEDLAYVLGPSNAQKLLAWYNSGPTTGQRDKSPDPAHPQKSIPGVPQSIVAQDPRFWAANLLWMMPEIGVEGWDRFITEKVLPELKARTADPSYNPLGNALTVTVEASHFIEMFAAYEASKAKPAAPKATAKKKVSK